MQRKSIVFFYMAVSNLGLQRETLERREKKKKSIPLVEGAQYQWLKSDQWDSVTRSCTKDAMVEKFSEKVLTKNLRSPFPSSPCSSGWILCCGNGTHLEWMRYS